jgi:DNA-binding SARP family transcriptional activator
LETFWPGADPARSRNRLQVALSGTRRQLRRASEAPIVEYHQGSYRIQPEVEVHTDVEHFERSVRAAQNADLAGERAAAMVGYSDAIQQYRDDFCADSPFEEWTIVPRESLRIRFIDVLDRTAELQEEGGDLNECIGSAQRMLEQDPCREDVHRLLMRCYSRRGRSYQVLRQFELCKRVLWAATATAPSPQTIATYLATRDGEGS